MSIATRFEVSPLLPPIYNVVMAGSQLEDMKKRIGFDVRDSQNLRALRPYVGPALESVVTRFYDWLLEDPQAKSIFRGGDAQIARQKQVLLAWLSELFSGSYSRAYYEKRLEIGRAHVRAGMPQHYMLTAMEVVWQELRRVVAETGVAEPDEKLNSLHKLLTIETAIMLESYKESYATQIREEERTVVEEKLTRSEHLAQIGQLAASLAHEIKNPLAGISGAIQVIRGGMRGDDPHRKVIKEILGQINRLDATVKDLLVYARPKPPERRPCDLRLIVKRTLDLMRGAAPLQRVEIQTDLDADLPLVPADMGQIEQLVMNLVFNAAYASGDGETITIALSPHEDRVRLVVTDHGHGMDERISQRAFEPFFTTRAKGTGLGLPICKKIVDAHDGTITLSSARDVGTQLVVELPRVSDEQRSKSAVKVAHVHPGLDD